ncbi:hypothetical protein TCSYLVIO_007348 [Trypanosoma cruzi]|uniref:Nucleosome assembly protein n=2 Tax=Trypanosoma cruzi TaxID=5693 RepID=V5D5V0_TRYCR|nr:hypothetical protein TCSYLVIO_007348 [Trypanosoma cruzi]ESS62866.1 hypothetical protein TCDM_09411 [Trypanosoma cruzi Dm28c]PBJ74030.1 hypothetical protein BCY84_13271 [Trypanosoma cruzi cruzi]PBJ74055.1 hypothetical protein BCY84_13262 [Trypanosoma cruzi cruzi]PWU95479.1 hypothetical protein C4B63_22g169 [Trypanosoma cruzi]
MAAVGTKDALAREIQTRIDLLQAELHKHVKNVVVAGNLKRNAHYTARQEIITKAIESGELPRTFWADAIVAALETPEVAEGNEGRLLGNYDAALLREYLQEVKVEYTEAGVKVMLTFAPNPFFQETVLWGEERHYAGDEEEEEGKGKDSDNETKNKNNDKDEDDDADNDADDVCRFSGITWKPGHGPEDDGNDHHSGGGGNAGMDKGRNGTSRKRERSPATTQGWSFLDVFSKMLPHPEEDEAFDEADDDELADAVENWESEMEDRRDLLLTLVEDVWLDPIAALMRKRAEERDGSSGPRLKRMKTE